MKEKRRLFLLVTVVFTLSIAVLFAGAQKEATALEAVTLQVGHIFPTSHVVHRSLEIMADFVAKETNGELKLEIFPLGQLGQGANLSQNVMLGTVNMATAGPGLLSGIEPTFGIWGAEYMFKDADALFKVINSPVGQEIYEKLRTGNDIRVIGTGYLGARNLTTTDTPVKTPTDLKGLKIRIPNIPYRRAAFLAMGASPTPMAFQELYLGLQQGVVDGQENPFQQIYSMKFYEVQKYLILTEHAQNPEMLIINDKKFRSLSDDLQKALLKGAEVYGKTCRELFAEEDAKLLEQLKAEGMTVVEPDNDAFREAVKDVPAQFEKDWGEGLYEKVQAAQQ